MFACQKNSFLNEFTSTVISCNSGSLTLSEGKKGDNLQGFEVICEDTILFPEGGGQPYDKGYLNDVEVLHVERRGTQAVHFVKDEIPIGTEVVQKVDWVRRFDHMQQHSGQHLISALIDQEYGFDTVSWWLGEQVSYVGLDTSSISEEQITRIENMANEKIREAIPVEIHVFQRDDPQLVEAKTRGLPADHEGVVRVISIGDVDNNVCCGTHVTNLAQVQAIKLLHAEKGKKGTINLHFLCGNRVFKQLAVCIEREKRLTALLMNNPSEHVDLVDKLQKSLKIALKNGQTMLKDLAIYEVEKIKKDNPQPRYVCIYRKDGDTGYSRTIMNSLPESILKLIICGEKGDGQMLLHGPPPLVAELGPKICNLLSGKGAAKGNTFMAKITAVTPNNVGKAEGCLKEYFIKLQAE